MALLQVYPDFLNRVEELGFLPLSHMLDGLTSLSDETTQQNWHTGNPDTDPWQWKDRAAAEKKLAYGCILGGQKGFVAARLYPLFFAACHPRLPMQDRWAAGEINQHVWQLWLLFEKKTLLNTSEVRKELGVSQKQGGSRVDAALIKLQQEYYLTVAGSRRKLARDGQPYGWPANTFDRVLEWAPEGWLKDAAKLHPENAWEVILDAGQDLGSTVARSTLARALGRPR